MSRYCVVLVVFCTIFLETLHNASLEAASPPDSISAGEMESLKTRIIRLEDAKNSMVEAREKVYEVHKRSIESANKTYNIVQWILYIAAGLFAVILGGGLYGVIKGYRRMLKSVEKDVRSKATELANKEVQRISLQMDQKIKKLRLDPDSLAKEFESVLRDLGYYDRLFGLQSSENEQAKAIRHFIEKPAKGDPIVISALIKLAQAESPNLRAQSMFARYACGDKAALGELKTLVEDAAMREAAEEALREMRERFPEVAITS